MKIKTIFLLIILANVLQAQTAKYLNEDFCWIDKDTIISAKIKFKENGKFELIEDNFYDCTPTFSIYGRGEYQIIEDSILFVFDSIPHLKSECRIDSTNNNDEYSNLSISVFDYDGKRVKNAKLHWGKPKKKRRRITAQFFETEFDERIELKFMNNEEVNFVRIEKEGYYWGEILIPNYPNKDYEVKVILRPKPKVKSRNYISNTKGKLKIISDCEIQYREIKLKKESCY